MNTDSELYSLVVTTEDLALLMRECDLLLDSLYRTGDESLENTIKKSVRSGTAKLFTTLGPSREENRDKIKSIQELLKKMTVLRITLAFDPSQEMVLKISDWFKKNISAPVALNIKVDASIIGGSVIEFSGKYMDMSLRNKLEKIDYLNLN